ncbi:MAG TPA: hypothetical protein DCZ94_13745 [Lentisphaeria bacterium]|nr:MAG: hypothetical protein A2X48_11320 [Lentisphaerae bacterium GWF2_49_21]HBC88009.1 hypothetical protein [Lentisphaeria bacterium]
MSDFEETLARDNAGQQEISKGKIGPYRIIEFLGRGGTGIVYRAADADKAEIAIKVMTTTPFVPQAEISRFLREAEASKLLRRHPNIITVYDTGRSGPDYYIAMELVPGGRTLKEMVGKNLSIKEVLDYVVPVAQALAFAHNEGILHRDLKPANILINEFNQPLLADFGLAKMENSQQLTLTGTIMGTPRYMSPEQCGAGDGEFTNQSDIYSFGFMVYELLTGVSPYPVTPDMPLPEMFKMICRHEAKPPRKLRKDISRNLEAVVLKMLEKEKKLRYRDMSRVCADLEACRDGNPVSVRRLSLAERWEKWLRRHRAQAITVSIFLAIGGALYYFFVVPMTSERSIAKQKVDISAVAAKHKSERLEEEISALKNQGMSTAGEMEEGTKILLKARESLSRGRLDDAEPQFKSAEEWAVKNSHKGMLLESKNSLARIAMVKGQYVKAVEIFKSVAESYGKKTLSGQIAFFEAGAASWLQENEADAFKLWQEIVDADGAGKKSLVDTKDLGSYIKLLSKAMLSRGKNYGDEKYCLSSPQVLKGLGYWALAQNTPAGKLKDGYLAEAARNRGIFIWIKQEVEDEGKK